MGIVSIFTGLFKSASSVNTIITTGRNIQSIGRSISKRQLRKKDYYVTKQYKKVVIYGDGFGFVEDSFDFKINNPTNFTRFRRMFNIEDGANNSSFPSLDTMKKVPVEKRRTEQGFWYNTSDGFLDSPSERYWHDAHPDNESEVDSASENNPRIIKFEFPVSGTVNTEAEHNLTYSMSIPGMFPISKFKAENSKCTKRSTSILVEYDIGIIKYVVGFEHGFKFKKEPKCTVTRNIDSQTRKEFNIEVSKVRNNNFYTYYEFEIANIRYRDLICISWELPC